MADRCQRCAAFEALKSECRANPPVAVTMPVVDDLGKPALKTFGVFPHAQPTWWCMQFTPAPQPDVSERTTP